MGGKFPLQERECSADILLLIFEEIYATAPATLRDLRLASRKFNILVNPIVYRHLELNNAFVECFKVEDESNLPPKVADLRRSVRSAICAFTRQVTVNKALDWASVANLLWSLEKLNHLYWVLWGKEGPSVFDRTNQIPQSILDCLAECWPCAQVSIDSLSSSFHVNDFSFWPLTGLVSLKLQSNPRWGVNNQARRTFKETLLKCNQLKVLYLLGAQSISPFTDEEIDQSDRLPALEEIFLQGYCWQHSRDIANNFWDWSRLKSLRLESVFIIDFLESISPENLLQLRSFSSDGHCKRDVDHTRATVLMTELVRGIHSLEKLSINCSVNMFPIGAIRKHGPDLRVLWLRELDGVVHRPLRQNRVPTLSLHALLEIQSCCRSVMELALDLDQGMMASSFASLLTEIRNLRRLTMFVQQPFLNGVDLNNEQDHCPSIGKGLPHACLSISCQARESIEVGAASNFVDRTYNATCTMFQDLLLRKQGAAFEKLTLHVVGSRNAVYPDVFSVEGQRQQICGDSHERTFVYEPSYVDGRFVMPFEKQLVRETTPKSIARGTTSLMADWRGQ